MIIRFFYKIRNIISNEEFILRSLSTIILLSLFSVLYFLGNPYFSFCFIIIFTATIIEFETISNIKLGIYNYLKIFILTTLLLLFLVLSQLNVVHMFEIFSNYYLLLIISFLINFLFFKILNNMLNFLISNLIILSFFSLINILMMNNGLNLFFYLVILISAMDIFAYIGGKIFGNYKIAPKISNGKTIEGTLIGLGFTVWISYLVKDFINLNIEQAIQLGFLAGILGFLGDLLESFFKRKIGIKDSGKLIPGHGGLLDRFDGYILTLPIFNIIFII